MFVCHKAFSQLHHETVTYNYECLGYNILLRGECMLRYKGFVCLFFYVSLCVSWCDSFSNTFLISHIIYTAVLQWYWNQMHNRIVCEKIWPHQLNKIKEFSTEVAVSVTVIHFLRIWRTGIFTFLFFFLPTCISTHCSRGLISMCDNYYRNHLL